MIKEFDNKNRIVNTICWVIIIAIIVSTLLIPALRPATEDNHVCAAKLAAFQAAHPDEKLCNDYSPKYSEWCKNYGLKGPYHVVPA